MNARGSQIVGIRCYEFRKFLKFLISRGVVLCQKPEIICPVIRTPREGDKCDSTFIQIWNFGKGQPYQSSEHVATKVATFVT